MENPFKNIPEWAEAWDRDVKAGEERGMQQGIQQSINALMETMKISEQKARELLRLNVSAKSSSTTKISKMNLGG